MNLGKTLFAQVMEYVPWKTFGRIIERHGGDSGVRTLGCADLFRVMAFSHWKSIYHLDIVKMGAKLRKVV